MRRRRGWTGKAPHDAAGSHRRDDNAHGSNAGSAERWGSVAAASGLMLLGLRKGKPSVPLVMVGCGLLFRGVTGRWPVYPRLGRSTRDGDTRAAHAESRGVRVEESVVIEVPVSHVYAFWRHLENLPRFITHLESVRQIDRKHSHWVARGPAGGRMDWNAAIINEIENQLISWRSLEGADVASTGSVTFWDALGGRGAEVAVRLQYDPPAGKLGAFVAWLFGDEPSRQLRADLQRLKHHLEMQREDWSPYLTTIDVNG